MHIAKRITAIAGPIEILVSRTVVALTAGSDLQFNPRGERQLKGVPGTWAIFAAKSLNCLPRHICRSALADSHPIGHDALAGPDELRRPLGFGRCLI